MPSMGCRGKSEGKDKCREDELLHVIRRFCPFADGLHITGLVDLVWPILTWDLAETYGKPIPTVDRDDRQSEVDRLFLARLPSNFGIDWHPSNFSSGLSIAYPMEGPKSRDLLATLF